MPVSSQTKSAEEYADALKLLLNAHPEALPYGGEVAEVQVLAGMTRKTARKRRPTADKASDQGDSIYIVLRPGHTSAAAAATPGRPSTLAPRPTRLATPSAVSATPVSEAVLGELVRALRDAEQAPGHSFVALKWFRDGYLPQRGYSWAQDPGERDRALRAATARGWVRIEKIANPRNPGFPTSVLHAALDHPGLRELLGEAPKLGWDFTPIQLKGEPMSATVRKMRDGGY